MTRPATRHTLYMYNDTVDRLNKIAKKSGIAKSQLVDHIISDYLAQNPSFTGKLQPRRATKKETSIDILA